MVTNTRTSSGSCKHQPNTIVEGDVRDVLRDFPDDFFDLAVTSPPYWGLRDYTEDYREVGQETSADQYVMQLASIFGQFKPKLKATGSLWVNIADTYRNGPLEIPQRFSYLMRQIHGWHLVNAVIWYKIDAMSESVNRRFSQKYEMFYWFVKDREYYYFNEQASKIPVSRSSVERLGHKFNKGKSTAVSRMRGMLGDMSSKVDLYLERGVNAGDVWAMPTNKERVEHSAPYPIELIVRPIVACCPPSGRVFDPFMGSGTTALAVIRMGENRTFYGTELNPSSVEEARRRIEPELVQGRLL